MSAIVIGANGLIGNEITRTLAATHQVWAVGRDATALNLLAESAPGRIIATTLRAIAVAMKYELQEMRAGAIVNVASSAGTAGAPGMSAYVAAKHGVIGLTRTAAIDYAATGIRVNAVAPGPIESGPVMAQDRTARERIGSFVPMHRMGAAAEVAQAVEWLASKQASFVTGVALAVDGGKGA